MQTVDAEMQTGKSTPEPSVEQKPEAQSSPTILPARPRQGLVPAVIGVVRVIGVMIVVLALVIVLATVFHWRLPP